MKKNKKTKVQKSDWGPVINQAVDVLRRRDPATRKNTTSARAGKKGGNFNE